mgnify:CR=1 FL=1
MAIPGDADMRSLDFTALSSEDPPPAILAAAAASSGGSTPERNKSIATRLKSTMLRMGLMQQPSAQHVDKKTKAEDSAEDKATATVGFVGRAVQLSLGASLTTFGECVGEQLDFLSHEVDVVNTEQLKTQCRVDNHDDEVKQLKDRISALEASVTTVQEAETQRAADAPAFAASQSQQSQQCWKTQWAVMGNLGWDLNQTSSSREPEQCFKRQE